MYFLNAFVGVPQSRYAAIAVLTAMLVVSLTILFGNDAVPLSQKFAFVFMLFLVSLPGLLLSLFQLTCIVVGAGKNNQRPWCSIYAWIISILLIVYCALLIILAVTTLTNRSKTIGEVAIADAEKFVGKFTQKNTFTDANKYAAQMFKEQFATATSNGPTSAAPTASPASGASAASAASAASNPLTTGTQSSSLMPANAIGNPADIAVNMNNNNPPPSVKPGVPTTSAPVPPLVPTQPFKNQHFKNQQFKNEHFNNQKFKNENFDLPNSQRGPNHILGNQDQVANANDVAGIEPFVDEKKTQKFASITPIKNTFMPTPTMPHRNTANVQPQPKRPL